jgi:hypothetical protein
MGVNHTAISQRSGIPRRGMTFISSVLRFSFVQCDKPPPQAWTPVNTRDKSETAADRKRRALAWSCNSGCLAGNRPPDVPDGWSMESSFRAARSEETRRSRAPIGRLITPFGSHAPARPWRYLEMKPPFILHGPKFGGSAYHTLDNHFWVFHWEKIGRTRSLDSLPFLHLHRLINIATAIENFPSLFRH